MGEDRNNVNVTLTTLPRGYRSLAVTDIDFLMRTAVNH